MALFEIVDEITRKQFEKTETGDNRMQGVVVGQVSKNYDKDMPGRVCVQIVSRDTQANELLWARVAMPSSGEKWGHYFLPEVGDEVLVAFEQGNIERPYIIGCIPKLSDQFLKKSVDEKNQIKRIVTRHGSTVFFEDNADDQNGGKDKIRIITAGEEHKIEFDNEKDFILISDKSGKNKIHMKTKEGSGNIEIHTEKKLFIKVGDNIKLTLNGSNGTVELSATKVVVKASDSVKLQANGRMDVAGGSTTVKGNSTTKVESSGPVTVSGMPIKLG
ncbi:MAG: hypothetical protein IKO80_03685 [Lachnospiraceae bacterium]|nr:hypothetical protein [Lachnospiraceae bacterium]